MIFKIANFRGAQEVNIQVKENLVDLYGKGDKHPVTLTIVAGKNFQGKTSAAQAVSALLTGEPKIYPEIKKKTLKELVMDGKDQAMITFEADDATAKIIYPECELETNGDPISASRMAMGLDPFVDMDKKKRLIFYCDAMKAEPTKEQLAEALGEFGFMGDIVDKLWENIIGLSWDATHLQAEEKGRTLKSKWKEVTGESAWGINKGESWLPEQWSPELMNTNFETLELELKEAKEWYDAGQQQSALDEAKLNELQGFVDGIDTAKSAVNDLLDEIEKTKKKMTDLQTGKGKLLELKSIQPCPHCGELIETKEGAYVKSRKKKLPEDLDKQIANMEDEFNKLGQIVSQLYSTHGKNQALLEECLAAEQKIKAHKEGKSKTQIDLADAKERYNTAQKRIKLFNMKKEADNLHIKIKGNKEIVSVLAPNGLRMKVLSDKLVETNADLKELCESLGWGDVSINEDMDVNFISENGHQGIYWLTSNSEKYRIRATFQLYFAKIENAPLVIFDEFEMLDNAGRNGMIKTIMRNNIPAFITITVDDKIMIDKLVKLGATAYWMKGGCSEKIK